MHLSSRIISVRIFLSYYINILFVSMPYNYTLVKYHENYKYVGIHINNIVYFKNNYSF